MRFTLRSSNSKLRPAHLVLNVKFNFKAGLFSSTFLCTSNYKNALIPAAVSVAKKLLLLSKISDFDIWCQKVWPLARLGPRGSLDFLYLLNWQFSRLLSNSWVAEDEDRGVAPSAGFTSLFMCRVCFTRGRGRYHAAPPLNSQRRHFTPVCYLFTKPILPLTYSPSRLSNCIQVCIQLHTSLQTERLRKCTNGNSNLEILILILKQPCLLENEGCHIHGVDCLRNLKLLCCKQSCLQKGEGFGGNNHSIIIISEDFPSCSLEQKSFVSFSWNQNWTPYLEDSRSTDRGICHFKDWAQDELFGKISFSCHQHLRHNCSLQYYHH